MGWMLDPEASFPTSLSWMVAATAAAANPGCMAPSQAWGLARCACPLALASLEAVLPPCWPQSLVNCPSSPCPQTQGAPHFQTVEKRRAEPMARGAAQTWAALSGHLLIREEFAWRTGLRQLVCCVLSCNGDAAGWHGLGPSHWAAVFGSSKSLALLEQRGIQDADPNEDEKAPGSQTPCPPQPPRCLAETIVRAGDTAAGGQRGRYPAPVASAAWGRSGREAETGGGIVTEHQLPARQHCWVLVFHNLI